MGALAALAILVFLYWVLDGEDADSCVAVIIALAVLIAALAVGS